MATAVVAVEGVLKRLSSENKILEGIRLYQALKEQYTLILTTTEDVPVTALWLERAGLRDHMHVVKIEGALVSEVNAMNRMGQAVDLVITPDPVAAQNLFNEGYLVLLFISPNYSSPEWRPGTPHKRTSWDDLVQATARDLLQRERDHRLDLEGI